MPSTKLKTSSIALEAYVDLGVLQSQKSNWALVCPSFLKFSRKTSRSKFTNVSRVLRASSQCFWRLCHSSINFSKTANIVTKMLYYVHNVYTLALFGNFRFSRVITGQFCHYYFKI